MLSECSPRYPVELMAETRYCWVLPPSFMPLFLVIFFSVAAGVEYLQGFC